MTDETIGKLAWHTHHNVLCELLTEPLETRIDYIKTYKPRREIERRLQLLKLVVGPLPNGLEVALMEYNAAKVRYYDIWKKLKAERNKLRYTSWWVRWYDHNEWRKVSASNEKFKVAREEWSSGQDEWWHALEEYESLILELHSKECLGCPWDGKTIFPKELKGVKI